MRKKLTPKQRAFALEYTKDFNATQAAIRAGYSPKTAKQSGYDNMKKPYLVATIEEHYSRIAMSVEEAVARLSSIARGQVPPEVEELKSHDVIQALKTILKHHGELIDHLIVDWRHEVQAQGLSSGDLFEELVNFLVDRIPEEVGEG